MPVLLPIISVNYTISCCSDHHLWSSCNYREGCQKRFWNVWDNMVWWRQIHYRLSLFTGACQCFFFFFFKGKHSSKCFRQVCLAPPSLTVKLIFHNSPSFCVLSHQWVLYSTNIWQESAVYGNGCIYEVPTDSHIRIKALTVSFSSLTRPWAGG